jgi:hypothetical protein
MMSHKRNGSFWHLASIRTDPPNGRYWGHSGHWPELALIDSVAIDPQRTLSFAERLNTIESIAHFIDFAALR